MIAESRATRALKEIGRSVPGGQVMQAGQTGGEVGVYGRSTYGGGDVFGTGVGYYGTACYDCMAYYSRPDSANTGRYDRRAYYDRGNVYS